jgi:lysophospholipase L1-like esterase
MFNEISKFGREKDIESPSYLEERIDNVKSDLTEKANKSDLQNISKGSPSGTYATVSALQTAFPTGNANIYVVTADGKWYYWNGSAWTVGGIYQATQLDIYTGIKNLYDNTSAYNIDGRTLNITTGATSAYAARFISTPINVEPNTTYIIAKASPFNIFNICGFSQYNASQTGSTGFTESITFVLNENSILTSYKFTTGATTVAIRFDALGNYASNTYLVCKLSDYDGLYYPFNKKFISKSYINSKDIKTSEILNDANFITKENVGGDILKLNGLKIYCLGDSITQQSTFIDCLVSKAKMVVTNYGVGGTRLADTDGAQTNAMCYRWNTMNDTEPDVIFIMGGTNDCYASTIGTVGDTTLTTVAGAVYTIVQGLQAKYPNAYIVFSCMPRRFDARWDDYANIVLNTCTWLNIPCVDMFHQSGITQFNYVKYMKDSDKVHPNALGGQKMAQLIINMLQKVIY